MPFGVSILMYNTLMSVCKILEQRQKYYCRGKVDMINMKKPKLLEIFSPRSRDDI